MGPPATATGEEIVEFLRQQSTDVLATIGNQNFVVIDGHVLPSGPLDIYTSARHNQVELLLGSNSDEGEMIASFFARMFGLDPEKLDAAAVRKIIAGFLSVYFTFQNSEQVAEVVASEYLRDVDSTASSDDFHKVVVTFLTDVLFLAPTIKTANHHSRTCCAVLLFRLTVK